MNKEWKPRESKKERIMSLLIDIIFIISVILMILLQALDNHVVGYDHFIGIPTEWVRSLYDMSK